MGNWTITRVAWQTWTGRTCTTEICGKTLRFTSRLFPTGSPTLATEMLNYTFNQLPRLLNDGSPTGEQIDKNQNKGGSKRHGAVRNKLVIYKNQTSTEFFFGAVTPTPNKKLCDRKRAWNDINQWKIQARESGQSLGRVRYIFKWMQPKQQVTRAEECS